MDSDNPGTSSADDGPPIPRFSQRIRTRIERDATARAAIQATVTFKTAAVLETEHKIQQTLPLSTSGRSSKTPTKALAALAVAGTPNLGINARRSAVKVTPRTLNTASVRTSVNPKAKTQSRATAKNPDPTPSTPISTSKGMGLAQSESPSSPGASFSETTSTITTELSIQSTIEALENEAVVARSPRTQALTLDVQSKPSRAGGEIDVAADRAVDAVSAASTITTLPSPATIPATVADVTAASTDFAPTDPTVSPAVALFGNEAAHGTTETTDDIATAILLPANTEPAIVYIGSHRAGPASLETANRRALSPSSTIPELSVAEVFLDSQLQVSSPPISLTQLQEAQALALLLLQAPSPDLSMSSRENEEMSELPDARCGHQNPEWGVPVEGEDEEIREEVSIHYSSLLIADDEDAQSESIPVQEPDAIEQHSQISEDQLPSSSDRHVVLVQPSTHSPGLSYERRLKRKSDNDGDKQSSVGSSRKSQRVEKGRHANAEGNFIRGEVPQISWEMMKQGRTPRSEHMAPDGIQMNEWIRQTTNHLIVDHVTSAGPCENPLSTVIYWMPRIPPTDGLDQRTWGGQFQYWVIPVWPITSPTDGPIATTNRVFPRSATAPQTKPESYVYHLRTADVAHWLHISTQDLVAFLSLAHPKELEALNLYLNFRRELMLYIPFMPTVIQWAKNKIPLGPGDHMYELLSKIKTLDDERQRILTWQLHISVLERRSDEYVKNDPAPFFATLPLKAPYPYDRVQYRKDFHHVAIAWQGFRRRQSAVKDFYDDPLRWFIAKDRPFENERSAILDMAKSLWEDERELAEEEIERWMYKTGGMMEQDENLAAGKDMRYAARRPTLSAHEKIEEPGAGSMERDLTKITAEEFVFEWRRDLERLLRHHRHEAPAYILETDLQIMRDRTPDLSQINPMEILQGPIPARKANSLHRLVMDHMANPDKEINWHPEGPPEHLPRWTGVQLSSTPRTLQRPSPSIMPLHHTQALVQQYDPPPLQLQQQSEHDLQQQLELQQQFERQQQCELQQMLRLLFEQPEQCQRSQQNVQQQQLPPQLLPQQSQVQFIYSQQQQHQHQQLPQILLPQLQQLQSDQHLFSPRQQQQLPQIQFHSPEIQLPLIQLQFPENQLSPIQQQQQQYEQISSVHVPQAQLPPIQLQAQFPEHEQQLLVSQQPQIQPHSLPQEQEQEQEQEQHQLLQSPPLSDFQGYGQLPPLFPTLEGDSEDFDYFFN